MDVHLHRAHIAEAVLAPDLLVQLVGCEEIVRVPDKKRQDAELHIGQMDALAVLFDTVAVGIQRKSRAVVTIDAGFGGIHLHPADVRHDAGQQDLVIIRFGQKIVAAQFQRTYHSIRVVKAGSKDDGAVVPASQPLAQVHAIGIRQQDVHQDHIEVFAGMAQRLAARLGTDDLKILPAFQKVAGRIPDHRVILHQKHTDHPFALPFFAKI